MFELPFSRTFAKVTQRIRYIGCWLKARNAPRPGREPGLKMEALEPRVLLSVSPAPAPLEIQPDTETHVEGSQDDLDSAPARSADDLSYTATQLELFSELSGSSEEVAAANLSGSSEDVPAGPGVDLSVTSATAPETAAASNVVSVSWTVKNLNSDPTTSAWTDAVYFSTNATFDFSDTYIGDYSTSTVRPLPGASDANTNQYTFTRDIRIPGSAPAGNGFLIFLTDIYSSQSEANENNNFLAKPISIIRPDVDLEVTTFTGPDAGQIGGAPVSLSWTVTNTGGDIANADWNDAFYLSTDQAYDASDVRQTSSFIGTQTPLAGNGGAYTLTRNITLRGVTPGSYYLLVRTDDSNQQAETDDTDNVRAIPITLTLPNVDLSVPSVTAPDIVAQGSPITVTWSTTNTGTQSAQATWSDLVYLSADQTIDFNDSFLGSHFRFSSLESNGSYSGSVTATVPSSLASGTYYVLVGADYYNEQGETNENNNRAVRQISIGQISGDLAVSDVTAPASAEGSNQVNIGWRVTNTHATSAATAPWVDRVWLSTTPSMAGAVRLLTSQNRTSNLEAGAFYDSTATVRLSASPLAAEIEGNNTRETANDISGNFTSTGSNVYRAEVTGGITPSGDGDYFKFSAGPGDRLVVNQVKASGSNLDSLVYLHDSAGNILRQDDDSGGSNNSFFDYTLPANAVAGTYYLRAAAFSTGTGNYRLSLDLHTTSNRNGALPDGTYYVVVQTDAGGTVIETSEANNSAPSSAINYIESSVPADLTVESITASATIVAGQSASVSWTVKNAGGLGASGPWTDAIYLSRDGTIDASDVELATVSRASGTILGGGATYSVTQSVTIPVGTAGDNYFLLVKTDRDSQLTEGEENNNTRTSAVQIRVTDLVMEEVSLTPTTAALGSTFNYSFKTKNAGNVAVNSGWYDGVFLSSDATFDNNDTYLAQQYTSSLTGGASTTALSGTFTLGQQTEAGPRFVLFVTDYAGYVAETGTAREANNVIAVPVTLLAPDLTVTGATVSSNPVSNNTIDVSWAVRNQGNANATADWYDRVYLSDDAVLDNSDRTLGEFYQGANSPLRHPGDPSHYYFFANFDQDIPGAVTGPGYRASVGGFDGLGPTGNQFDNNFLANTDSGNPADAVTLTLTNLPAHTSVSLDFLLALIDSWDGNGNVYGAEYAPDLFNVKVDGVSIFSKSLSTLDSNADYPMPYPAGVGITSGSQIYGSSSWDDTALNMGALSELQNIPHTGSTLTVELFASGAGWQGGGDEYFAIDNLKVTLDPPAVQTSYEGRATVTLPSASGSKYLLFATDVYRQQGETNETNNVLAREITIA
ncbi:MAG TPA: CARDB domain-containing protein, partial [Chthoniobacteraceae bacterium]